MDLKELDKLLKVCRKQGVISIEYGDVRVKFGDMPIRNQPSDEVEEVPTDELSPDQLMFYHLQDNK